MHNKNYFEYNKNARNQKLENFKSNYDIGLNVLEKKIVKSNAVKQII